QRRQTVGAELFRLRHREQFDKEAGQLDQVVMGAPRMTVARADGEAEPSIELGCRLEIAHSMDDVVESAGHLKPPSLHRREGRRLQEHVGNGGDDRSIALAFRALAYPFRVDNELIPFHLALSERFPREEIVEVLVAAGPNQNRPEPGLPDAVSLPELERRRFEPL